jgi:hypothetical protein
VCLLLRALVAIEVDEGIVDILLLEVVMEGGELLGRGQQFGCDFRVGLLGLIELLLEVELLPVDL